MWRPSRVKICKSDALTEFFTIASILPTPAEIEGTPLPVETKFPLLVAKVRLPSLPEAWTPRSARDKFDALLKTPLFRRSATSSTLSHTADEGEFGYALIYRTSKLCRLSSVDPIRLKDSCCRLLITNPCSWNSAVACLLNEAIFAFGVPAGITAANPEVMKFVA